MYDDGPEPLDCPMCDTPNTPMGTLGSRVHYRCRACGMMYSQFPSRTTGPVVRNPTPGRDRP